MGTRNTQNRIIDASITLFNGEGTSSVSLNRIAEQAGISKGNLHYHYSSREEIILAIWRQIELEMNMWIDNTSNPTIDNVAEMTLRQFRLIWRYRFFYRELNVLLSKDPELRYRFVKVRKQRINVIKKFVRSLAENGVLQADLSDLELEDLIKTSWVVSDFWLSYISVEEDRIDIAVMQEGYRLILQLFEPVLTPEARANTEGSFSVFTVSDCARPLHKVASEAKSRQKKAQKRNCLL